MADWSQRAAADGDDMQDDRDQARTPANQGAGGTGGGDRPRIGVMVSDIEESSESEDEETAAGGRRPAPEGVQEEPEARERARARHNENNVLRLLRAILHAQPPAQNTNEEVSITVRPTERQLVDALVHRGAIRNDRVRRAMLALSRRLFVPARHIDEAFVDSPLRVSNMDFNISAPHMYGMCLTALDIQPGHDVLDIGSGCGHFTALAAILAGPMGSSTGLETRADLRRLGAENLSRLLTGLPGTAPQLTDDDVQALRAARFIHRNCFLVDPEDKLYDRIHVGASCPVGYLNRIVAMLNPKGIAVLPSGDELLKLTLREDGEVDRQVLAQVSYGDLVLPSKADVVQSYIERERVRSRTIKVPPSTIESDRATVNAAANKGDTVKLLVGANTPSGPDEFTAQRALLAKRSEYFCALVNSGMQDAGAAVLEFPDIPKQAVQHMLQYINGDAIPQLNEEEALDLLQTAKFFQIPRLLALCEAQIKDFVDTENVCVMLEIADEHGADQLKRFCINYCIEHYAGVSQTETFAAMPRHLLAEVGGAAIQQLTMAFPYSDSAASAAAPAAGPFTERTYVFHDVPARPDPMSDGGMGDDDD